MKELILVTAHCPDQKRKDKLQNFAKQGSISSTVASKLENYLYKNL